MSGTLPLAYQVPLATNNLPQVSVAAYVGYNNCRTHLVSKAWGGTFKPFAPTTSDLVEASWVQSPKYKCTQQNVLQVGRSIMLSKDNTAAASFIVRTSIKVEFYTF